LIFSSSKQQLTPLQPRKLLLLRYGSSSVGFCSWRVVRSVSILKASMSAVLGRPSFKNFDAKIKLEKIFTGEILDLVS
jgi:hypothetical protein